MTKDFLTRKRSLGQGMTEYIIITALIAVAAIGVYSLFGETVRHQVAGMAQEMSGQSADEQTNEAQDSADQAVDQGTDSVDLGTYDDTATDAID